MDVSGLQKLTLLDYPGRVACTIFTGGCDLRCPFCHNASLALPERERDVIGHDELMAFLKKRVGILDGVAVTYGPGLVGALLCGVAYKLCPKLPAAYAGEVFGTGILGGLASYPIAAVLMGNTKAALFTFVPSFLISTAVGAAISVLVLSALKRTHVFSSLEGALR